MPRSNLRSLRPASGGICPRSDPVDKPIRAYNVAKIDQPSLMSRAPVRFAAMSNPDPGSRAAIEMFRRTLSSKSSSHASSVRDWSSSSPKACLDSYSKTAMPSLSPQICIASFRSPPRRERRSPVLNLHRQLRFKVFLADLIPATCASPSTARASKCASDASARVLRQHGRLPFRNLHQASAATA